MRCREVVMSTNVQGAPRLHRSRSDRKLWGVCGGMAEFLGVDPTWVRLAFVAVAMLGGAGVVAYLVLAIVLPVDDAGGHVLSRTDSRQVAGVALIGIGLIAMVGVLGWFAWVDWRLVWPVVM